MIHIEVYFEYEGQCEIDTQDCETEEEAIVWLCGMTLVDWEGTDLDQFVKFLNDTNVDTTYEVTRS